MNINTDKIKAYVKANKTQLIAVAVVFGALGIWIGTAI